MPTPFLAYIGQGRYQECLNLAEGIVGRPGQTIRQAAQAYHAIARCRTEMGDALGATRPGELAADLADRAGDSDLLGLVLIDLAASYGKLRRYQQQVRVLQRYLAMASHLQRAVCAEAQALLSLGEALVSLEQYAEAETALSASLRQAVEGGLIQVAERARRLLRAAHLRGGKPYCAKGLFPDSARYIQTHPEDWEAAFWYAFDNADYVWTLGQSQAAFRSARRGLEISRGQPLAEFAAFMQLHRFALQVDQVGEAAGFAMAARIVALEGERYDMASEALSAVIGLVECFGHEVLGQLERSGAMHGVNLLRYIPERLWDRQCAG